MIMTRIGQPKQSKINATIIHFNFLHFLYKRENFTKVKENLENPEKAILFS